MIDPVLDQEGNSYQRSAIEQYLLTSQLNPHNQSKPLQKSDLIPNKALKIAVEEYLSKNNINPDIMNQMVNEPPQGEQPAGPMDLALKATSFNDNALVTIVPPKSHDSASRTPLSICAVIDVSGSMSDEANIKSDTGKNETYGFTILDLVKHALRTIINSLNDVDNLALVKFESDAKVELKITKMNAEGKNKALQAVNNLAAGGSTNIWAGLETGLNVIKEADVGTNVAILLLTDGQPVIVPPRGHLGMLQKYRNDAGGQLPAVVHTFGFGNNLDSKLLNELATEGHGAFAFIPDGSFVGTIFVNSISNLLNTFAAEVTLSIKNVNQTELKDSRFLSWDWNEKGSRGVTFNLGSIRFGQSINLLIPKKLIKEDSLEYSLSYVNIFSGKFNTSSKTQITELMDPNVEYHRFRIQASNLILDSVLIANDKDVKGVKNQINELVKEIEGSVHRNNAFVKDLLVDLKEQVTMALTDFFLTWGKHYLLSIGKAHLYQICNNFKDPGVQHYAGDRFTAIRDLLDGIFLKLPAPVPSIKRETNVKVQNMGNYYNRYGGCFHGESRVKLAGGSTKLVNQIRKGDHVATSEGGSSEVICVTKIKSFNGQYLFVQLEGGLRITPWHPIRIGGSFIFPRELKDPQMISCDAVYNFVLKDGHLMTINGVECVTLGHNFKEGAAYHDYFGTDKVINDLMNLEGWDSGMIPLDWDCMIRDENTGLVIGLKSSALLPQVPDLKCKAIGVSTNQGETCLI